MEDILNKIGLNQRINVGISVSSNNLVEMICVDKLSRSIVKYATRELKYNNAIREIIDYDEFAIAVSELFKELGLNPKMCNVVLNLPNVHFGFINLPLILPDDQITTAIASEVEQLYLFKRHEPIISWNTTDQNKEMDKHYIVYTALQEIVLDNIKEIFEEIGTKLVAIENSYSSLFKGIQYSRIIEDEISQGKLVNILLISPNNYSIFCLKGNKVVDYFEEPLAIKSFTNDEVYLAISSAASNALSKFPSQNLLLVSGTDEVSAELLADKLMFNGPVKYLDCNKYSEKPFIDVDFSVLQNYRSMISLEAVGAATYSFEDYPIKFNLLSDVIEGNASESLIIPLFGKEIEIDRKAVFMIGGAVAAVLIVLFIVIWIISNALNENFKKETIKLSTEQKKLEAKIKASNISVDSVDIYSVTQKIHIENKKALKLYKAISKEIPDGVWLDSYYTNSDGEVYIVGKSTSSEYIYAFFKGLKATNSDLFLSKLEMGSNEFYSSSDNIYTFEITSTKNKNRDSGQGGFLNPISEVSKLLPITPPANPIKPMGPSGPPPITTAP